MFSRVFETTTPENPYQGLFFRTSRFEAYWDTGDCPGAQEYQQSNTIFESTAHIPGDKQNAGFRACNSHSNSIIKRIHAGDQISTTSKRICLIDWPLSSRGAKYRTLEVFSAVYDAIYDELMADDMKVLRAAADDQVQMKPADMLGASIHLFKGIKDHLKKLSSLLDKEWKPEWNWVEGLKAQVEVGKYLKFLEEAQMKEVRERFNAAVDNVVKEEKHRRQPANARYR